MSDNRPIAILDSGTGGLSVMSAINHLAKKEPIYYFGDTAHFPYGIKSPQLIKELALEAAHKIVKLSKPKLLVIACHTISSICLKELSESFNVKVIGMTEPSINALKRLASDDENIREVLILSTRATLNSKAYQKAWGSIDNGRGIKLNEHACGPLVNLVEDGLSNREALMVIAEQILPGEYLSADALLLGCTHFSVLKNALSPLFKESCKFIDAAEQCASESLFFLEENALLSKEKDVIPARIFVSDNPERFAMAGSQFSNEKLKVELIS